MSSNEEDPSMASNSNKIVTTSHSEYTEHQKIDHITSLQEGIDGLSLSLFEALRGLRDAVAPESGNLGGVQQGNKSSDSPGNSPTETSENDFEEFCQSYHNGDPDTLAIVKKLSNNSPIQREDFLRIHKKIEMEKDAELVKKVASTVLERSAEIDRRVSCLPGMNRTKREQLKLIEELIEKNRDSTRRLEDAYSRAESQRNRVRVFVRDNTCVSLGIIGD